MFRRPELLQEVVYWYERKRAARAYSGIRSSIREFTPGAFPKDSAEVSFKSPIILSSATIWDSGEWETETFALGTRDEPARVSGNFETGTFVLVTGNEPVYVLGNLETTDQVVELLDSVAQGVVDGRLWDLSRIRGRGFSEVEAWQDGRRIGGLGA